SKMINLFVIRNKTCKMILTYLMMSVLIIFTLFVNGQSREIKITKHYLNIPIGHKARMRMMELKVNGNMKREFPVQLAEDSVEYWIYIDVSEFRGKQIIISCNAGPGALQRIYQDDRINGEDSLYMETNRPQFHFTVKRGWSNDINGPIYYNGQYHLFWQSFPFGLLWNTGFMYWGHAVSSDLVHWKELEPALMLDSLGSPWSGTAVVDKNNDGGWGKDALVLYYACFDRISYKQVQCIAYSTDNGKTFTRYTKNPVIDSNWELKTTDTRDPKVFWHEDSRRWVMVLFEKDGMSFYNSTDMRHWERESHFKGLYECPDFFELPVDGNANNKKWVLHGGSSDYLIGSFDGKTFIPESEKLQYAEGRGETRGDYLYAAESFENMPDGRRVQMAWGRIEHPGMPFTQMMLFPTEFTLKTTIRGIRLLANPIKEIEQLQQASHEWSKFSALQANKELAAIKPAPLQVKAKFTLTSGNRLSLRYQGNEILNMASSELPEGENEIEILIDKTVAEIFINKGERYIIRQLLTKRSDNSLEFDSGNYGPYLDNLKVYEIRSIW
ncbi:MAG: glycoside hydrolase family 32 protein, partial [Bacteroidota bacterium]|nr:glycoside hydrolase family 32 protein [Bacteroidota bacterium]